MRNKDFCHLHVHNEYSILDGLGTAKDYVGRAKNMGFEYLGLTNHGNIDGLIKFQKECDKQEIKPVLGCEAYIVEDLYKKEKGDVRAHITLLIKNQIGFQNLCKMLTVANLEGFYYKPRIDFDLLCDNCEGLIILTGCSNTFLNLKGGKALFFDLWKVIGNNLYLEVMPHDFEDQKKVNELCLDLREQHQNGINLVGTNDCHYINANDEETQNVLLAIQTRVKWQDENRFQFKTKGLYLRSYGEMKKAFQEQGVFRDEEIDWCLDNTIKIAEKCSDFRIEKQDIFLPVVPKYKNEDPYEFLWQLIYSVLSEKNIEDKLSCNVKIYERRLQEEWDLIDKKGFVPYFCIVKELVDWCKEKEIMIGVGRGSVGGSLVSYLLGITSVDPIKYNLLFSRFIAEDRNDLPDIDLDFEDSKRHLVREHLEALYGKNNVASISTFLRMKGRAAIRDVARVFDLPLKEVNEFSKLISYEDEEGSIKQACESQEGNWFGRKYPEVIKHAIKLEGQVRGLGQHAAAIIISADDLAKGIKGNLSKRSDLIVSNWDMEDSEYMGLMKLDVLGLNTLSVLNEVKRTIKENYGRDIIFEEIPLDDKEVYSEISTGNNIGIFQISGWTTNKLSKKVKADNIFLLSDLIALSRPGAFDSGMTDIYLERRKKNKWVKKHSIYEKITKDTYGIIVYQEQVMEVIYKIAGLPYSIADKVRKIIAKKSQAKEFKQFKDNFIDGCLKNKYFNEKEAEDFWEMLQAHAKYSFNKSHSIEYSIMAYWTAWLKYYYPVDFICANLNYGSDAKKEEFIEEAYRLGLQIELPKIGFSEAIKWIVKSNILYVPFIEIKGIGEKLAKQCVDYKPKEEKKSSKAMGGFFDVKPKKVISDKPKGKIGSILEEIEKDSLEILQKYFSFRIKSKIATKPKDLKIEIIKSPPEGIKDLCKCKACELRKECTEPVYPSLGKYNIIICGEAPGKDEDERGKGFIGKSGRDVLWPVLKTFNLYRQDFYVTNINKCYPRESATPIKSQIVTCGNLWLKKEIETIKPCLMLVFGNTGLKYFAGKERGIMNVSGNIEWNEKYQTWICYCLHPSAVLRNPNNKQLFVDGIKSFSDKIKKLGDLK